MIERPAYTIGIVPLADFGQASFTNATVSAYGHTSNIQGYQGGVFDMNMVNATGSYYLDCMGQQAPPGLLLYPNGCPLTFPTQGGRCSPFPGSGSGFTATWDDSY